jgi:hypothetical protein
MSTLLTIAAGDCYYFPRRGLRQMHRATPAPPKAQNKPPVADRRRGSPATSDGEPHPGPSIHKADDLVPRLRLMLLAAPMPPPTAMLLPGEAPYARGHNGTS